MPFRVGVVVLHDEFFAVGDILWDCLLISLIYKYIDVAVDQNLGTLVNTPKQPLKWQNG